MQFQVINRQGGEKKKARLQKELHDFTSRLQALIAMSRRLLVSLQLLSDKKQAEKIEKNLQQL